MTGRTLTESYGYDAASNRTSFTDPESGVTNYNYDTLNRMTGLMDFNGGAFYFSYDALGRRTSLARPNGVSTSYQYDALSRLLSILHQSSAFNGGTTYAYDAAGNRTSRMDTFQLTGQSPTATTTSYGYDQIYELTQAVVNGTPAESYTYDAVGNRLSSLGIPSYSYNSSNELTSASPATFTYDANGNMTGKTAPNGTTTYAWDFENRLTSVTVPKGTVLHYQYDPFGRRIFSDGTGRIFVYDGDNVIENLDLTGKVVARYTQGLGIDEPLEVFGSGASSYYEADGLGSITSLTSASGAVANTYNYDSFGNQTASTGSVSNRFYFTARENVAKTGLLYYRARYYDPSVGRFLNEDPAELSGGDINVYRYVSDDPVDWIDPDGLGKQRGGQGKGERKQTGRPEGTPNPAKHARPSKQKPGCWEVKDPHTGKWVVKPPGWVPYAITDFELQMHLMSAQYMQQFWTDILVGDAVTGAVGIGGAIGGVVAGPALVPASAPAATSGVFQLAPVLLF
ncbi:MAG TPA: RHS repeat-associated core domain-containing protein [Terriglobia bacterium]|nr:RHS repeat-associated core domain-containing protein [Terriglobia bacterium]